MKKLGQKGVLNILLIPLVLAVILLIVAVAFGFSAYKQEQKYKTQTDQIVAQHVQAATQNQQQIDQKNFAEESKQPLATYTGPSDYGSIQIKYPKTWSLYVDTSGTNNTSVDGYGNPGFVPADTGTNSYPLRFQVVDTTYDQVLQQYQQQVQSNLVSISPYQPKNIKGVIGVVVTGQIENNKQGEMIVLPLRNTTFELYTDSQQFLPDFTNYILPNFSFSP